MYDNSVRLIGFLGKDAEMRTARNKTPYVILSLATTVRWRSKESQEKVERTEWHRLVAWGNLAKFAGTLKRGNHISAEGELRYRIISDKDNSEVEHRLAEIHLAKSGSSIAANNLVMNCPPFRPTIRPRKNLLPLNIFYCTNSPDSEGQDTLPTLMAECASLNPTPSVL